MNLMNESTLTPKGEKAWLRLKQHLEWCEHFALGFIFTEHPGVISVFRERLADIHRARVTKLMIPIPDSPEDLINSLLTRLLHPLDYQTALNKPFWIDLSYQRGAAWAKARLSFLTRLNEQRESLRKALGRPLILILPQQERTKIKIVVPDLWAIRDFSLETGPWVMQKTLPEKQTTGESSPTFPLSSYDKSIIKEWKRLSNQKTRKKGFFSAAQRAFTAYMKAGHYQEASLVAQSQETYVRSVLRQTGETPESLRDLSVSLNNVGKTSVQLGDFDRGRDYFEQSLEISRKIVERVGETPESLRDLSVSLDNVGKTSVQLGDFDKGRDYFEQSLEISRKIVERVGETPESLRDLSVSLDNVGKTSVQLGDFDKGRDYFEQSLEISRKIVERVGETPESLRDLSVSLDNVGKTSVQLGDFDKGRDYFEQSLEISRKIVERVGARLPNP